MLFSSQIDGCRAAQAAPASSCGRGDAAPGAVPATDRVEVLAAAADRDPTMGRAPRRARRGRGFGTEGHGVLLVSCSCLGGVTWVCHVCAERPGEYPRWGSWTPGPARETLGGKGGAPSALGCAP